jgi:hypothetical protein
MRGYITVVLWTGRVLLEFCELAVRARRALNDSLGDNPWRRPGPWFGDRGAPPFWQGR